MEFTSVNGQVFPIEIRRRKGTRYLRLSLGQKNQIVGSVPWHCSEKELSAFIEKQRDWLETQLQFLPRVYTLSQWLHEHPQLTASGDIFELKIEASSRRIADYSFDEGGSLLVLRLPVIDDISFVPTGAAFAKDALNCRLAYHAKRLGLSYRAFSVRDQSSRWGSCSTRQGISLNWRLVLLRPELQDYIILHELAHLTEMNHSKHFWALLDQYCPARSACESALNRVSPQIMRIARNGVRNLAEKP